MARRILGWLPMVAVIAVVIAVQALDQAGSFSRVDGMLNNARILVPESVGLAVLGAALPIVVMVHGLATDATNTVTSLNLDDRVGSDTTVKPGKVAVKYRGRTTLANVGVIGYFWGRLLWGRSLYEVTRMSDLKRSWRSGEWLHVHRYLRATLTLAGLLMLLVGIFGTVVLLSDFLAVRLLLAIAVVYALVRTAFAFARA